MKTFLILFFLLPFSATAAMLADCDKGAYEVTVNNGGAARVVTITPTGGNIQEFGALVSFQIKGQPPVKVMQPDEEYCIWSGRITIQRRNTLGTSGGGCSLR